MAENMEDSISPAVSLPEGEGVREKDDSGFVLVDLPVETELVSELRNLKKLGRKNRIGHRTHNTPGVGDNYGRRARYKR